MTRTATLRGEPVVIRFNQTGDFEAERAAEAFLAGRGFSVGRKQAHAPRGILLGDFDIQKWRNLRPADREALHGQVDGGRAGPVTVTIRGDAPPEVIIAICAVPITCDALPPNPAPAGPGGAIDPLEQEHRS